MLEIMHCFDMAFIRTNSPSSISLKPLQRNLSVVVALRNDENIRICRGKICDSHSKIKNVIITLFQLL